MKKVIMMLALLALPFVMQAQSKFHDVELNEASGPVKKITQSLMGQEIIIDFSTDGKMQRKELSDAVYDADGYLQSATLNVMGQNLKVNFTWEDGRLTKQSMQVMGQDMIITRSYNEQGAPAEDVINMGGMENTSPYTDYQYDDHGNWISRKGSVMGREMTQSRTIEYYD
jgi:hypothetical protein